jgi:hypothetical protein
VLKRILFLLLIAGIHHNIGLSQNEVYGNQSKFSATIGMSLFGPGFSLGGSVGQSHGEWYFYYHMIDWEKNEDLVNKPTSGGFQTGFNYFPSYGDEFETYRLKWFLGIGAGFLEERAGSRSDYNNSGITGEWKYYELHGGARYFITNMLSVSGLLGYAFYIDDSQTILKKYPEVSSGVEEKMAPLILNLTIEYVF